MLNSILEIRKSNENKYSITLQMNEADYFSVYDTVQDSDASELIKNYLRYRADDGKPKNIRINHNKNLHIVQIDADMSYQENEEN